MKPLHCSNQSKNFFLDLTIPTGVEVASKTCSCEKPLSHYRQGIAEVELQLSQIGKRLQLLINAGELQSE